MAGPLLSVCCGITASEHETEDDSVKYWCGGCRRMCKVKPAGQDEVQPRSEAQAFADQFNKDGTIKEENFDFKLISKEPQKAPTRPSDAPRSDVEVKDGSIYQDGKLIGYTIDDKTWYANEFGEDWKGSDKALKALRNR